MKKVSIGHIIALLSIITIIGAVIGLMSEDAFQGESEAAFGDGDAVTGRISIYGCEQPDSVELDYCTDSSCSRPESISSRGTQEFDNGIWLIDQNDDNTWLYEYRLTEDSVKLRGARAAFGNADATSEREDVNILNTNLGDTQDFHIFAESISCTCPFDAVAYIKDEDGNLIAEYNNQGDLGGSGNNKQIFEDGNIPQFFSPFNNEGNSGTIDVHVEQFSGFDPNNPFGHDALATIKLFAPAYEVVGQVCESNNPDVPACPGYSDGSPNVTPAAQVAQPELFKNVRVTCGTDIEYGWIVERLPNTPTPEPTAVVQSSSGAARRSGGACPIGTRNCSPGDVEIERYDENDVRVNWDYPSGCSEYQRLVDPFWVDVVNESGQIVCSTSATDNDTTCKLGRDKDREVNENSSEWRNREWKEGNRYSVNVYTFNPGGSCVSPPGGDSFEYDPDCIDGKCGGSSGGSTGGSSGGSSGSGKVCAQWCATREYCASQGWESRTPPAGESCSGADEQWCCEPGSSMPGGSSGSGDPGSGSSGTIHDCREGESEGKRVAGQPNKCDDACCGSNSDCPSGQSCNVGNGGCASGNSCNPNIGNPGQQPDPGVSIPAQCKPDEQPYKVTFESDCTCDGRSARAVDGGFCCSATKKIDPYCPTNPGQPSDPGDEKKWICSEPTYTAQTCEGRRGGLKPDDKAKTECRRYKNTDRYEFCAIDEREPNPGSDQTQCKDLNLSSSNCTSHWHFHIQTSSDVRDSSIVSCYEQGKSPEKRECCPVGTTMNRSGLTYTCKSNTSSEPPAEAVQAVELVNKCKNDVIQSCGKCSSPGSRECNLCGSTATQICFGLASRVNNTRIVKNYYRCNLDQQKAKVCLLCGIDTKTKINNCRECMEGLTCQRIGGNLAEENTIAIDILLADQDANGFINALDYINVSDNLGKSIDSNNTQLLNSGLRSPDIDGDGKVTSLDLSFVLSIIGESLDTQ